MRSRDAEEEDYLLRLIRQAADVLRRLRHLMLSGAGSPEVIRLDAANAIEALLGPQARILSRLDAMSAARLVGHPDHVALWGALLVVEADATSSTGDSASAARLHERARTLREAARVIWGTSGEVSDTSARGAP